MRKGEPNIRRLLFVPSEALDRPVSIRPPKFGLHLYVRRVMIMEHCEELLPAYLRFVRGVVDSSDLPLNVSRQRLQEDRHIGQIRKWITKKVLDSLEEMQKSESEKYLKFWKHFGRVVKEGASFDFDNKDKVLSLCLFESSNDPEKMTNLKDYVSRMKEGQSAIYYITGSSRRAVENSPHLEAFKAKGFEVLYLVDPVDEVLVQWVSEFQEKKLKSVAKGTADLGDDTDLRDKAEEFSPLLDALQSKLDDRVKQVRLSGRLKTSPVCLVVGEQDVSPNLEKLMSQMKTDHEKQKRILEINPEHELVVKMRDRLNADPEDPLLDDFAQVMYGYALLAEGSELDDPLQFNQAVMHVMAKSM